MISGSSPRQPALARLWRVRREIAASLVLVGISALAGFVPAALAIAVLALVWGRLAILPRTRRYDATMVDPDAGLKLALGPLSEEVGAAAQLRDRGELEWRAVIDALPDAAIVLDRDDFLTHFNPFAADLFPQIRIGLQVSQLSRSPDLLGAIERARAGGERVVAEFQDRVPVERRLSAFVSRLRGGERAGEADLLIVLRDVTDQERLAQMRADFIANASHELRTPLASLKGFVETLQGPARNDSVARDRFLGMMATQAARMSRLIDDLLSLSRVEMRVHLPPRGEVDLNETLGFVVQTLEPSARSASATVTLHPCAQPARVRGERDELVQVFQNLVQNAIKYGRTGGRVDIAVTRLSAGSARPQIAVSVKDDGPGIAAVHLPRLTERFYRVSVASSRDKGGTGLGLAIVKHIVARHRGELKIASEVGKGAEFTVVLDAL